MDACRLGGYRPAHRTSEEQRQVRAELAVRGALVRTRARFISLIRALLRREGLRVRSGMARSFPRRVAMLTVPEPLSAEVDEREEFFDRGREPLNRWRLHPTHLPMRR